MVANSSKDLHGIGGLSSTTKMPWFSYSLPAGSSCPGSAERCKSSRSVCSHCYARKGRYKMASHLVARATRIQKIALPTWVDDFVSVLARKSEELPPTVLPRFRWHDSGDIMSSEHLRKIVQIAQRLPGIMFWLPTQNAPALEEYLVAKGELPTNLCVRYGMPLLDQRPGVKDDDARLPAHLSDPLAGSPSLKEAMLNGVVQASIVASATGSTCPATFVGASCAKCQCYQCWSRHVACVSYKLH